MDFNLVDHTILAVVGGSRAYGMAIETSDVDMKGVAIPPERYRLGYLHRFEQADKASHIQGFYPYLNDEEKKAADDQGLEGSIYDIRKFFKLAADNNPNILDVLFCRDSEVKHSTPVGDKLREHARDFLSTKSRFTFAGFAFSQLKRINTHRKWLLDPPTHQPTREEYDISKEINKDKMTAAIAAVKKQVDSWEIDFGDMSQGDKVYIQNQMSQFMAEQKLQR